MQENAINWYPGHMKKTREEIISSLKLVNLVVEILDARAPISSKNPDIDKMINGKDKLVVFTKKDLSKEETLEKFIKYYNDMGVRAVAINATNKGAVKPLLKELENIKEELYEKNKSKGIIKNTLRIMIVGVPNVGKSTIINQIIGKKKAKTGNTPGVTRSQQWLKIKGDIELLDTPGILWPKIQDEEVAKKLTFLGSIKDEVVEIEEIYYQLIKYLIDEKEQKGLFDEFEIPQDETDFETISNIIAQKRGFIKRGNEIDYFRLSNTVLTEFRNGKYSKVQLDKID